MLRLGFKELTTVLCLGAHADDVEMGCGGTILRMIQEQPGLKVWWLVFSANETRRREARASARAFLKGVGEQEVVIKNFRDGFFPFEGRDIKECFERLKKAVQPDLIFTHHREDRHQDHRVVSDLAWNTFRNHLILEYEIPKYDGDLGVPNAFMPLSEEVCQMKVNHLMRHFQTQKNKHWFTEDLFFALLRIRGMECGARYAEAFHCRKVLL